MEKLYRLITELVFGVALLFGTATHICAAALMGEEDIIKSEEEVKEFGEEPTIETPLTAAVLTNNVQELQRLFDAGDTDLEQTNSDGAASLMLATQKGFVGVVQWLLDSGAQVDAQFECKLTHNRERKEYADRGEEFECHGGGDTALMMAAAQGWMPVMEILFNAGANGNAQNKDGDTALMWAAKNNNADAVRFLLLKGVDKNIKNSFDYSALAEAVIGNAPEAVEILLQAGVDSDKNIEAQRAIDWNNPEALDVLLKYGAVINMDAAANDAAELDKASVLNLLFERGAQIDKELALLNAASFGHLEVVQVLLDAGADINAQDEESMNTALIFTEDNAAVVETLLKHGAGVDKNNVQINHVDTQNGDGDTALTVAVRGKYKDVARLLILAGAKGTIANNAGETAMSLADDEMKTVIRAVAQEKAAYEAASPLVVRNQEILGVELHLPEGLTDVIAEGVVNPFGPEAMALRNKQAGGEAQEDEKEQEDNG